MSKEALIKALDTNRTEIQVSADTSGNLTQVGNVASGATDSGNPVKVGGVAKTTNPTAVTDGQRVNFEADKIGRQIAYPYQVRDLMFTARALVSTGTETTLFAGVAGVFHDLVWVSCSNNSTAATTIDLRSETGAGIVKTLNVGATADTTVNFEIPYPQNTAAATWTADLPDITGTTVSVDALFIRNV